MTRQKQARHPFSREVLELVESEGLSKKLEDVFGPIKGVKVLKASKHASPGIRLNDNRFVVVSLKTGKRKNVLRQFRQMCQSLGGKQEEQEVLERKRNPVFDIRETRVDIAPGVFVYKSRPRFEEGVIVRTVKFTDGTRTLKWPEGLVGDSLKGAEANARAARLLLPDAQKKMIQQEIWGKIGPIPEGERVLEVGVGVGGSLYSYTADQLERVVALDVIGGFLDEVEKKFPNVETLRSDWCDIKAGDGSFIACIGFNALNAMHDRKVIGAWADEVDRVLKPLNGIKRIHQVYYGALQGLENWYGPDYYPHAYESGMLEANAGDYAHDHTVTVMTKLAYPKFNRILKRVLTEKGYQVGINEVTVHHDMPENNVNREQRRWLDSYDKAKGRPANAIMNETCAAIPNRLEGVPEGFIRQQLTGWVLEARKKSD